VKGLLLRRTTIACCAIAFGLLPSAVAAAASMSARVAAPPRVQARGSVLGTITAASWSSFTIQTPGRPIGVVNALAGAASSVTNKDYPYVYGGGHAQAGTASIGIKGSGYNGRRIGFDCSGAVAAVLAAAGLWQAGSGVPNDAGIVAQLRSEGLIARGVGTGPVAVTLYDHPGVHIFMSIDGRFFGTSDGAGGGNPRGGAGWLDDGAPDAMSPLYKSYHFVPSVLRGSTSSGHDVTFQTSGLQDAVGSLSVGDKVQVTYEEVSSGSLVATAIAYPGASTTNGTVGAIANDGSSFTIQPPTGASLTFSSASIFKLDGSRRRRRHRPGHLHQAGSDAHRTGRQGDGERASRQHSDTQLVLAPSITLHDRERGCGVADELAGAVTSMGFGERDTPANTQRLAMDLDHTA
jgi:hypothetical protein